MKIKISLFIIISLFTCVIGIALGSVMVPIYDILTILGNKFIGISSNNSIDPITYSIIWNIRIPRVLLAFLVGFALSISGAIMQSTLKNPLASSYTLGVSSGAALGVGIVMMAGITIPLLGIFTLPVIGLICALITVYGAIGFANSIDKNMGTNTIILAGMVFSLFVNAILTLISALSREDAHKLILWQMGSFSQKDWTYVFIFAPIAFVISIITMKYTNELDLLTFGEEHAKASGVDTLKVKWILLSLSSALTGCAISFTGTIGFVDLVAPHIIRKIFGSNHKYVIPFSGLFGGIFMVISDLIARTIISPSEIPVGAVTALIGSPFFAYIYFSNRKG